MGINLKRQRIVFVNLHANGFYLKRESRMVPDYNYITEFHSPIGDLSAHSCIYPVQVFRFIQECLFADCHSVRVCGFRSFDHPHDNAYRDIAVYM